MSGTMASVPSISNSSNFYLLFLQRALNLPSLKGFRDLHLLFSIGVSSYRDRLLVVGEAGPCGELCWEGRGSSHVDSGWGVIWGP